MEVFPSEVLYAINCIFITIYFKKSSVYTGDFFCTFFIHPKTPIIMSLEQISLLSFTSENQLNIKSNQLQLTINQKTKCSGSLEPLEYMLVGFADRKSTRLNSSHVRISYA